MAEDNQRIPGKFTRENPADIEEKNEKRNLRMLYTFIIVFVLVLAVTMGLMLWNTMKMKEKVQSKGGTYTITITNE